jgi:hypothetical protein
MLISAARIPEELSHFLDRIYPLRSGTVEMAAPRQIVAFLISATATTWNSIDGERRSVLRSNRYDLVELPPSPSSSPCDERVGGERRMIA